METRDFDRILGAAWAQTSVRDRDLLLQCFEGKAKAMPTYTELGAQFEMGRENVRQVLNRTVRRIRRHGGPPLEACLEQVDTEHGGDRSTWRRLVICATSSSLSERLHSKMI